MSALIRPQECPLVTVGRKGYLLSSKIVRPPRVTIWGTRGSAGRWRARRAWLLGCEGWQDVMKEIINGEAVREERATVGQVGDEVIGMPDADRVAGADAHVDGEGDEVRLAGQGVGLPVEGDGVVARDLAGLA